MIALLLALFVTPVTPVAHVPVAQVEAGSPEAVFVPAGWTGPVVAAPFDEVVFE